MTGAWRITVDGRESLFPEDTWAIRVDDRSFWPVHLRGESFFAATCWEKIETLEYIKDWPAC